MLKSLFKKILKSKGYYLSLSDPSGNNKNTQPLAELIILARNSILPDLPVDNNEWRLELLHKLIGTNPTEALYIIDAISKVSMISGDVCEFGIAQGATSALIANELRNGNKKLWLFDSFKGLPKPTDKDKLIDDFFNLGDIHAYEGSMAFDVYRVKDRLREISIDEKNINIVAGFIEETINNNQLPEQVSFAYVDFDFYEPIKIALNYLHRVVAAGGIIIVDDYDFFSTGAKTAVDEFMAEYTDAYNLLVPQKELGHFAVLTKLKPTNV